MNKIYDFVIDNYQNNKCEFMYFMVTFEKQKYENTDYISIFMYFRSQIKSKRTIIWDVVCPEINYQNIQIYSRLSENETSCGTVAFVHSKLLNLNCLTVITNIKIVY
eukprot:193893_1